MKEDEKMNKKIENKRTNKMTNKINRPKYWMSLEQWKDNPIFKELAQKEFISAPFAPQDESRRDFLKLMGASLALTSLGCLRRPAEKIVPYVERPRGLTPGKSLYYASSFYDGAFEGLGIMVETRAGRPIKIEGLKEHPSNRGGMSSRAHAHLLELYDPERLKKPRQNLFNKEKTNYESINAYFDTADPDIVSHLKEGKTAILTDDCPAPFSNQIIQDFLKAYDGKRYIWDPLSMNPYAKAFEKYFGAFLVPSFKLNRARVIVSVNCDFLSSFLSPVQHLKDYAKSRKPGPDRSRLVVFESLLSLTGSNADERMPIRPSDNKALLLSLTSEVLSLTGKNPAILRQIKPHLKTWPETIKKLIHETAADLSKNPGKSLILFGGPSSQNADFEDNLILSLFLNNQLGNFGNTIDLQRTHHPAKAPSIEKLIEDLEKNKIKTVLIHRTNPLYSYPDKERLKQALKKASLVIYTGAFMDETAAAGDYIFPDHHDLEKWMLFEFQRGRYSIGQPTVRPLIDSRSFEDSLIVWARMEKRGPLRLHGARSWHDYLKSSALKQGLSWDELRKKGFQEQPKAPLNLKGNLKALLFSKTFQTEKKELILYTSSGLKDGRLSGVSWLQEFPDPITKICWDNYLCFSLKDAREMNLTQGQMVEIKSDNVKIKAPAHIQPGQTPGVLGLALGYGKKLKGEKAIGVNAYPFLKNKQGLEFILPVDIKALNEKIPLASVQEHHSMEGRQIVVETTLARYLKNPKSGIHKHKIFSLWSEHEYPREKWGMVIDLNSCTGCGACITACQSENNIPVVGKKYVLQGREMHWIRIDRYYEGQPENPSSVLHQPVVCMHCDNAPCETVCPVAATVHSDEGTNDMIYNRCVGTRYCSNNCPYKVRRFNWFNYSKNFKGEFQGALNPDVTVRSRGVMEKCTFCIHRIRKKQADSRLKNIPLKDGDIQTACQQSCPSNAILFGNLNDKKSKVRQAFEEKNAYSLLEELNTKPAVRYRTRIKNTKDDLSSIEADDHHG